MRKLRRVHESELWKTRKQEVRMSKMEGLLDTIKSLQRLDRVFRTPSTASVLKTFVSQSLF